MMYKDIINLIAVSIDEDENDIGDPIEIQTKSANIFADKKDVRQSEFYQAAAIGLKPVLMFEIRSADYNSEPILEYNSKQYQIIRTFDKGNDFTELVCQGIVNGVM